MDSVWYTIDIIDIDYFTNESRILILEDLFYTWHAFVTCFYLNRQNDT